MSGLEVAPFLWPIMPMAFAYLAWRDNDAAPIPILAEVQLEQRPEQDRPVPREIVIYSEDHEQKTNKENLSPHCLNSHIQNVPAE